MSWHYALALLQSNLHERRVASPQRKTKSPNAHGNGITERRFAEVFDLRPAEQSHFHQPKGDVGFSVEPGDTAFLPRAKLVEGRQGVRGLVFRRGHGGLGFRESLGAGETGV